MKAGDFYNYQLKDARVALPITCISLPETSNEEFYCILEIRRENEFHNCRQKFHKFVEHERLPKLDY